MDTRFFNVVFNGVQAAVEIPGRGQYAIVQDAIKTRFGIVEPAGLIRLSTADNVFINPESFNTLALSYFETEDGIFTYALISGTLY